MKNFTIANVLAVVVGYMVASKVLSGHIYFHWQQAFEFSKKHIFFSHCCAGVTFMNHSMGICSCLAVSSGFHSLAAFFRCTLPSCPINLTTSDSPSYLSFLPVNVLCVSLGQFCLETVLAAFGSKGVDLYYCQAQAS